jgi:hypothetical protein
MTHCPSTCLVGLRSRTTLEHPERSAGPHEADIGQVSARQTTCWASGNNNMEPMREAP